MNSFMPTEGANGYKLSVRRDAKCLLSDTRLERSMGNSRSCAVGFSCKRVFVVWWKKLCNTTDFEVC